MIKVPYSKRRGIKRFLVPRKERRKKKRQIALGVAIGLIVALFSFVVFSIALKGAQTFKKSRKPIVKEEKQLQPITFLIIGSEKLKKGEKSEETSGLLVTLYDPISNEINSILIPKETFLEIPGQGFEKVGKSLAAGIPTAILTIRNFFGIYIDHYLKISARDFERIVGDSKFERAFLNSIQSDLTKSVRLKLSDKIARLNEDKIKIMMLPVTSIKIEGQSYLEPQREEVERLVSLIWGKRGIRKKQETKVVVLNGCGLPGIGGEVAQKLIENGFRILDIKNANNFDYEKTQIILYKNKKSEAQKVKRILGMGEISIRGMPQELVDITVIIGKDYSSRELEL